MLTDAARVRQPVLRAGRRAAARSDGGAGDGGDDHRLASAHLGRVHAHRAGHRAEPLRRAWRSCTPRTATRARSTSPRSTSRSASRARCWSSLPLERPAGGRLRPGGLGDDARDVDRLLPRRHARAGLESGRRRAHAARGFVAIDGSFVLAGLPKFLEGGYVPLAISARDRDDRADVARRPPLRREARSRPARAGRAVPRRDLRSAARRPASGTMVFLTGDPERRFRSSAASLAARPRAPRAHRAARP